MAKTIVVEGCDGMGKSTQVAMLVAHLRSAGKTVALVKAPVKDLFTYNIIYWMLKNGTATSFAHEFQMLQYLNKRLFQAFKLKKLERDNDYIVFDRWSLSAVVYGNASGVDSEQNAKIYDRLRKPDVTVVITGKLLSDHHEDKYESDTYLQRAVKKAYASWVWNQPPGTAYIVDNTGTPSRVHFKILNALKEFLS